MIDGYNKYINSKKWQNLRKKAIDRDGGKCQKCRSRRRLHVHHLWYPFELGTEPLEALTTLCEDCHRIIHGGTPRNTPKSKKHKTKKSCRFTKVMSGPVKIYAPCEIAAYQASI